MLNLLIKRRSIRRYKSQKVSSENINELVQAALLSPTSRNLKSCCFIAIDDEETLVELAKSKAHGSSFLANAPLGIVILGDTNKTDVWIEDAAIAATVIHLTAASMGLGSCWIQIRGRQNSQGEDSEAVVRRMLNIPDNYSVEAIISCGHPDEVKAPSEIPTLSNNRVFKNYFGSMY